MTLRKNRAWPILGQFCRRTLTSDDTNITSAYDISVTVGKSARLLGHTPSDLWATNETGSINIEATYETNRRMPYDFTIRYTTGLDGLGTVTFDVKENEGPVFRLSSHRPAV